LASRRDRDDTAMTGYAEAIAQILAECAPLEVEMCPVADAHGRVLAVAVRSPIDLPPFDNSAMDGFALKLAGAVAPTDTVYIVGGRQAAGDVPGKSSGDAWEITTGASLPEGLDSVVAVERVEVLAVDGAGNPTQIRLRDEVRPGNNVRYAGSDIAADAEALDAGMRLDASAIMLLASMGVAEVAVRRAVRVAIVNTGKELVDDPSLPLAPGSIRHSNGPYLAAALASAGVDVVYRRTVDDVPSSFTDALSHPLATRADIVISTGAVSMGRHDFVPEALRGQGARVLFHKVEIRPGKPLLIARFEGGPLVFCLPGNPMAVAVGLRFFVMPALRALAALPPERPLRALLDAAQSAKPGLRHFLKARVHVDHEGRLRAKVLQGQQAFRIRSLVDANAWVVLPERDGDREANDPVDVYGLDGPLRLEG
jgi:molybdopterin molybdotransferase